MSLIVMTDSDSSSDSDANDDVMDTEVDAPKPVYEEPVEIPVMKKINWRDERTLWTLSQNTLSKELRRRHKASKGEKPDLIARILQVDITQLNRKFELEASELPELNDSDVEFMSASKAFPKKDYDEQDPTTWRANDLREKLRVLGLSTVGKKDQLVNRYITRKDEYAHKRKADAHIGRPKKKVKKRKKDPYFLDGAIGSSDEAQIDYRALIFPKPRQLPIVTIPQPTTILELTPEQLAVSSSSSYHYFHADPFEHIDDEKEKEKEDEDDSTLSKVIQDHTSSIEELTIIESMGEEVIEQVVPTLESPKRKRGRPKRNSDPSLYSSKRISNIAKVQECVALKRIIITSHAVKGIEPLTTLQHLEQIWFSRNLITQLPKSMGSLANCCRVVDLSFNNITDISPLKELTLLTYLNLSFNKNIQDISSLATLEHLEELDLSGNSINDESLAKFDEFACNPKLRTLKANLNEITTVKPLAKLVNLKELSMNCNKIQDISPLLEMIRVREVDLQDNLPLLTTLATVTEVANAMTADPAVVEMGKKNAEVIQTLRFAHVRIAV